MSSIQEHQRVLCVTKLIHTTGHDCWFVTFAGTGRIDLAKLDFFLFFFVSHVVECSGQKSLSF